MSDQHPQVDHASRAAAHNASRQSRPGTVSRRRFSAMLLSWTSAPILAPQSVPLLELFWAARKQSYPLYDEAVARVIPEAGFPSRISLTDSVMKLIANGVIDRGKLFAAFGTRGSLPPEFLGRLSRSSDNPIRLTRTNANLYVNLLWPVGLATHMALNAASPINDYPLNSLASTGGWTLGREPVGGAYFNRFPIVDLSREQEARVVNIASTTFRPCCNNSTFFQDCNHGSALLGVLQLGASQGLTDDELYREALAFNSFWFPDYYIRTALLFKVLRDTEWADVDPRLVLGFDYSAAGPWLRNVASLIDQVPGLLPPSPGGGAACGV